MKQQSIIKSMQSKTGLLTILSISIVLVIGGIAALRYMYNNSNDRVSWRRDQTKRQALEFIQEEVNAYHQEHGVYPYEVTRTSDVPVRYTQISDTQYSLCVELEASGMQCVTESEPDLPSQPLF